MNKVHRQHKLHNLSFFRSDFFSCLLNTNFREGTEKSATLPLSKKAAELFIRFLYGFEFNEDQDVDIIDESDTDTYLDLLAYGELCGLVCLQDAVGVTLKKFLSKNNVFDILAFAKQHNAEAAVKNCIEYTVKNFSQTALLENGHLARHPDIAVRICERQIENDFDTYYPDEDYDHLRLWREREREMLMWRDRSRYRSNSRSRSRDRRY